MNRKACGRISDRRKRREIESNVEKRTVGFEFFDILVKKISVLNEKYLTLNGSIKNKRIKFRKIAVCTWYEHGKYFFWNRYFPFTMIRIKFKMLNAVSDAFRFSSDHEAEKGSQMHRDCFYENQEYIRIQILINDRLPEKLPKLHTLHFHLNFPSSSLYRPHTSTTLYFPWIIWFCI